MNTRFDMTMGCHNSADTLCAMSNEELAEKLKDCWDADYMRELCWRADMIDEYVEADDEFEDVVYAAAEKLGVEIK